MFKVVVPLALVLFLIVSYFLLDGWPFTGEGTPQQSSLERTVVPEGGEMAEGPRKLEITTRPVGTSPEGGNNSQLEEQPVAVVEKPEVDELDAKLKEAAQGDPNRYLEVLSEVVLNPELSQGRRYRLFGDLHGLQRRLIYKTRNWSGLDRVVVRPGDNLTVMAQAVRKRRGNNITAAFIQKINGLRTTMIRPKQELRIPRDTISLQIVKSDFRLYVLIGDCLVMDYQIGIGKDDSTPEGGFAVLGKTKNPDWTNERGEVIPFGHKDHIIGNRWMGFGQNGTRTSYGIHGTNEEDTIGKSESAGCIRMRRLDIEELFELIPEGCPVIVRP